MKIEFRPISSIAPYEANPRKNDAAVETVVKSITEFGWRQPIVVDAQGVIIVGHTRLKAAGITEAPHRGHARGNVLRRKDRWS